MRRGSGSAWHAPNGATLAAVALMAAVLAVCSMRVTAEEIYGCTVNDETRILESCTQSSKVLYLSGKNIHGIAEDALRSNLWYLYVGRCARTLSARVWGCVLTSASRHPLVVVCASALSLLRFPCALVPSCHASDLSRNPLTSLPAGLFANTPELERVYVVGATAPPPHVAAVQSSAY